MYAWVTTAYMLTSTVSVPIYGKLSDQYGRKAHPDSRRRAVPGRLRAVRTERGVRRAAAARRRHDAAHRVSRDPGPRRRRADDRVVRDHGGPVSAARARPAVRRVRLRVRHRDRRRPVHRRLPHRSRHVHAARSRSRRLALGVLRQPAARPARAVHDHVSHAGAAAWRGRTHRLSRRGAGRADGRDVAARAHARRHDAIRGTRRTSSGCSQSAPSRS